MSMEHQVVGNSLVVRLAGELDLVAAAELRRVADDLLDRRKVRNLFVNLERVTFLDSSFLGALLGRYRRIHMIGLGETPMQSQAAAEPASLTRKEQRRVIVKVWVPETKIASTASAPQAQQPETRQMQSSNTVAPHEDQAEPVTKP
jgi:stage II sporulation protein AA (anti-sigma F factor antagonist)